MLRLPAPAEYAYAVGMGRNGRDFEPGEAAMLEAFRDHLLLAFSNARLVGRGVLPPEQPQNAYRIVVDDTGRVKSCAPGVEQRFAHLFDPCSVRRHRISEPLRVWLRVQLTESSEVLSPVDRHLLVGQGPAASHLLLVPDWQSGQHELLLLADGATSPSAQTRALPGSRSHDQRDRALAIASADWTLTVRQRAVLGELLAGKSNKEIAASLGCAEVTVEFHVSSLLRKAQTTGRAALVARVLAG